MADEGARRATVDDQEEIVALLREAMDELAPIRGGRVWRQREARAEPVEPVIEAALSFTDRSSLVVAGTVDGVIVGYGVLHLETMHDGATLAVVDDIFVTAQARGIGVGEAMMDMLIAEAREAGAVGIDSLALPGDRATKNFFERFGLTARAILVHRDLRPEGDR